MKQLLTLALLLGLAHFAWSQSLDAFKKSAEEAYEAQDYPTAYEHASEVLTDEPDNFVFLKIAAESALELCAFDQADGYFETIRSQDQANDYPLMSFYLAKSKHRQENYEEAQYYYEDFIENHSQQCDPKFYALAVKKLNECKEHENLIPAITPGVDIQLLVDGGYSDFALPYAGNTIYYSSLSPAEECDCAKPCRDKMTIHRLDEAGNRSDVLFPEGTKNVGHITLANNGQRMYFTQCSCKDNQYTCAIYYSDNSGNSWSTPVKLPETVNRPGFTITQPYFADGGDSGEDFLYFVSNYHEGNPDRTDLDIFKVAVTNNTFGTPIAVTEVNTTGDEVTPFFFGADKVLYFSSNGHHSLGGYGFDIFKYSYGEGNDECDHAGNSPQNPANIGTSFNTIYDELYFSLNETGEEAIFSSNGDFGTGEYENTKGAGARAEGPLVDSDHCCPNVYKATIRPSSTIVVSLYCTLEGDYGGSQQQPVPGSLHLQNMADSTAACIPAQVEEGYRYYFAEVPLGETFKATVEKTGYWGSEKEFTSSSCNADTVWVDLFLEPKIELEVSFRAKCNPELPIDVNGVTLLDQQNYAEVEMTPLYGSKHTYTATLRGFHNYTILPDSVSRRADNNEYRFSTATPKRNITTGSNCLPATLKEVFLLEIQPDTLPLFEPLPLYFNHAVPNPIVSATEAATDYETYFNDYKNRVLEFRTATGRCTTPNQFGYGNRQGSLCECNDDLTRVDTFFNEVQVNMKRMESFGDLLFRSLEAGDSIVINIRGVASKSGSGGYSNDDLSKRRINSMEKYLAKHFLLSGDGINDYMDKVNLIPDPVGASIANQTAPSRGPCRIYNVDASYDRRIEIVSIVIFPPDMQSGPCGPGGKIETYQSNSSY